jgi:hypothetical protein
MRRVVLVGPPIRLWDRARQHSAALVREFAFIVVDGRRDTTVAGRLMEIAQTSDARYANLNPEAEMLVEGALARGDDAITIEVSVPVAFKQHIIDAVPVLIEVDEYCRLGTLLRVTSPARGAATPACPSAVRIRRPRHPFRARARTRP